MILDEVNNDGESLLKSVDTIIGGIRYRKYIPMENEQEKLEDNFDEVDREVWKKVINEQFQRFRSERLEQRKSKMIWNDIRKKVPDEDETCLVKYQHGEEQFTERAYYANGEFRSLETKSGFPLKVHKWFSISEDEE